MGYKNNPTYDVSYYKRGRVLYSAEKVLWDILEKSVIECGFSNKNSVLKYKISVSEKDICDSVYGGYENYYNDNAYLAKSNKKRLYCFDYGKRKYEGCYDGDYTSRVYLKSMDEKLRTEIENDIKVFGFISDCDNKKIMEFEGKYGFFLIYICI